MSKGKLAVKPLSGFNIDNKCTMPHSFFGIVHLYHI